MLAGKSAFRSLFSLSSQPSTGPAFTCHRMLLGLVAATLLLMGTATAHGQATATEDDANDSVATAAATEPAATDSAAAASGTAVASASGTADTTVARVGTSNAVMATIAFLVVVAISLGTGYYMSRAVGMPDYGWKISLIVFSTLASILVVATGWPPKLGIDLSGGVILVYEVEPGEDTSELKMPELVAAISRRINPDGLKEVVVRTSGVKQIEIILPNADEQEQRSIENKISTTGALEFRILADRRKHDALIRQATRADFPLNTRELKDSDGKVLARWVPVAPKIASRYIGDPTAITRINKRDEVEVLVVVDDYNVTGQYLANARASRGQLTDPTVDFEFDALGARLFGGLTGDNLPDAVSGQKYALGVVLDGVLQSAPTINSRITDRGEISGQFTVAETEELASILKAGKLPIALRKEPSSSVRVGPQLGADTIRSGLTSMGVATIVVMLFMMVYYHVAGVVANLSLILNVLLIIAFMILFRAAFTLSGLAGLALTVGMAVDANVLIYERIREELGRGATLRMAIRNGFARAGTTIIDANVTTLITAVVLYAIGTDQVKGFAITLILGLVMNLFTAVFCARVVFDIAERRGWIKSLKMMRMLSVTNIDFIGKRDIAVAFSSILIAIGLFAAYQRGTGLLDIDFSGGVSVEAQFEKPITIAEVREKIIESELPDATVQELQSADGPGTHYIVNTSEPDIDAVQATLKDAFGDRLTRNLMTVAEVATIPGAGPRLNPATDSKSEPAADAPANGVPGDAPAGGASNPQSSLDQRFAGIEHMLAQADEAPPAVTDENVAADAAPAAEPASEPTAEPATEEPATEEPATTPAEETAAADEPTAEEPVTEEPATDAPAETPANTEPAVPAASGTAAPDATSDSAIVPARTGFAGGTTATLKFSTKINHEALQAEFDRAFTTLEGKVADADFELDSRDYELGSVTAYDTWTAKVALPKAEAEQVFDQVNSQLAARPFFPSSNKIGEAVAGQTQQQAFLAMLLSLILIVAYVWFRFSQVMFGLAAVVAVIHDVLIAFGAIAVSVWLAPYFGFLLIEPFKISLPIIAAFLTIIGYSLNDTIVIFDRIREIRGKSHDLSADLVNLCINQTLSRTILTSLTVLLVVLILYIFGGSGIHAFAFTLVVGTIAGTFSTVYIATPLLIWLNKFNEPTAAQRKS